MIWKPTATLLSLGLFAAAFVAVADEIAWKDSEGAMLMAAEVETHVKDGVKTITVPVVRETGGSESVLEENHENGIYSYSFTDSTSGWNIRFEYFTAVPVAHVQTFQDVYNLADNIKKTETHGQLTITTSDAFHFEKAMPVNADVDLRKLMLEAMRVGDLIEQIPESAIRELRFTADLFEKASSLRELKQPYVRQSLDALQVYLEDTSGKDP